MRNAITEAERRAMSAERRAKKERQPVWSSLCTLRFALCACFLPGCQPSPPAAGSVVAGRNALQAEQFDSAIADADDYLRGQPHGPDAAEAYYIKGYAYKDRWYLDPATAKRRDLHEARTAFEAGLGERPPAALEGYLHTGLSLAALYQDDFPTAIQHGERAMPLVDRPEAKAGLLYNIGLAQQRLGRFTDADQTFRQVEQGYPTSPLAVEAHRRQGQRQFYVQLATYASPADADRAMLSLRAGGSVVSRGSDARGQSVLVLGPFSSYAAAAQQQAAMAPSFPTAYVFP